MSSRNPRRGLGVAYHHLGYSACPCRGCVPSSTKAKRDWKRMLYKSARTRARRDIAEELHPRRSVDE